MNLYKYALEKARAIRNLSRTATHEAGKLSLPSAVVDELLHDFGVESVMLFRYTKKTSGLLQCPYPADGAPWAPSTDRLITIERLNGFAYVKIQQHHIFRVSSRNEDSGEEVIFFHIDFVRSRDFSDDEVEAFRFIMDFIGDFLKDEVSASVSQTSVHRLTKIYRIASEYDKAGTVMAKTLDMLCQTFQAHSGAFFIVNNQHIELDYFYFRRSQYFNNLQHHIDTWLHDAIRKNTFFEWKDSNERPMLRTVFRIFNENSSSEHSTYWISVVRDEQEPIAVWVFEFNKNQLAFTNELREFMGAVNELFAEKGFFVQLFQRKTKQMIVNPIFKDRNTKVDPSKVFVLMPFTLEWSDRIWRRIIKPEVEKLGLTALRADDMFGADIMEDVWKGILTARIVIADITARNANVFYELGIAHALGKDVILITQNNADIPFDLNRYRHIEYKDNLDGYEALTQQLNAVIRDILGR